MNNKVNSITTRIENIKEKLQELKEIDKKFSIFGSSKHKYELNSILREDEIRKIETDNNIRVYVNLFSYSKLYYNNL